ncbi:MAG: MFS transporter [Micavibrio sp.]|nr:MFS transporter [Micavibrio sp.]|tara:strand:+ start:1297 stop:2598 length:1302 start_codon:yes stop_codon:yes gene_type:complete
MLMTHNSRLAAFDLLKHVFSKKLDLEEALNRSVTYKALEAKDKSFARMIASTVLRRYGQMLALINQFKDHPEPLHPQDLELILCVGLAQILCMRTPAHAALNETVNLCEILKLSKCKGLVNGILRNIDRDGRVLFDAMSNDMCMPTWLYESWQRDYGSEQAQFMAEACLKEAPLDICVKNREDISIWQENLGADLLPTGALRLKENVDVTELQGFQLGAWWVQDFAAQIPAKLFGDIRGKNILDFCAAPGGKTMQLASMGASVTALDRSVSRMQRLEENTVRIGVQSAVEVVVADVLNYNSQKLYDGVLLDAPCTATGTIRRHPDLLHLKSQKDVQRLSDLQHKILEKAATFVKDGGMLIYATCSLQKQEGEDVIEAFLAKNKSFKRQKIEAIELGGLTQLITPLGDLRCLPHYLKDQGGMDGFYAARLVRIA